MPWIELLLISDILYLSPMLLAEFIVVLIQYSLILLADLLEFRFGDNNGLKQVAVAHNIREMFELMDSRMWVFVVI